MQGYAAPGYAQPTGGATCYPQTAVSETDRTLRMVAFVFCILSTIATCWLVIPLIWMVPMSVICWRIYQGTKPNTVAFDICTLIFLSMIAGILLLISKKDA